MSGETTFAEEDFVLAFYSFIPYAGLKFFNSFMISMIVWDPPTTLFWCYASQTVFTAISLLTAKLGWTDFSEINLQFNYALAYPFLTAMGIASAYVARKFLLYECKLMYHRNSCQGMLNVYQDMLRHPLYQRNLAIWKYLILFYFNFALQAPICLTYRYLLRELDTTCPHGLLLLEYRDVPLGWPLVFLLELGVILCAWYYEAENENRHFHHRPYNEIYTFIVVVLVMSLLASVYPYLSSTYYQLFLFVLLFNVVVLLATPEVDWHSPPPPSEKQPDMPAAQDNKTWLSDLGNKAKLF